MTEREHTQEYEQLEQTIAQLEAQRAILGDAVVDTSIAALRAQLAALEKPLPSERRKQVTEQTKRQFFKRYTTCDYLCTFMQLT